MNDQLYNLKYTLLGFAGVGTSWGATLLLVKEIALTISAVGGAFLVCYSIWKLFRGPKPNASSSDSSAKAAIPLIAVIGTALFLSITGCTFKGASRDRTAAARTQNEDQLAEQSRQLTTGARDALAFAPTNPPVNLAKRLLDKDQLIEGVPLRRLPIEDILAGHSRALRELNEEFAITDKLLDENAKLKADNAAKDAALIEMGKKYEAERNKSIVKRVWHWAVGIGGAAGAIAFFVFCPAIAIPLATQLARGIVWLIPSAYKLFGVVGRGAWDSVRAGIDAAKQNLGDDGKAKLESSLGRVMDSGHKKLVRASRGPNPFASAA